MPRDSWLDRPVANGERTRRQLIKEFAGGSLSVGAFVSLAGCTPDDVQRTDSSGGTPVRRSIASLQQSDPNNVIPTFKDAVRQMRNLPSSDPRNWQAQVSIHGTLGGFNECEHGNWLFLPWHRAYLFYFEGICRDLTGNQDFALPFWNWSVNRQIPDIFGQNHATPTGSANPLYNPTRRPGRTPGGASLDASTVGPTVLENDVLSDPNFLRAIGGGWNSFTGSPATSPKGDGKGAFESMHDYIHVWVGGDMMRGNSPNDPIFWTHHCFVDCVWWEWNARRGHSNPGDLDWLQGQVVGGPTTPTPPTPTPSLVDDFVDKAQNTVSDISPLKTLLMPLNAYRYENVGKGGSTTPTPEGAGLVEDTDALRSHLEEGADVSLEVVERFPLAEQVGVGLEEPRSFEIDLPFGELRQFLTDDVRRQFLLTARDIQPPKRPDFVTRLFVDHPRALEEYTLDVPRFAGNITFFEPGAHHPNQTQLVNVDDTLSLLLLEELVDPEKPVNFQLVPESFSEEVVDGAYGIGRLDLEVTESVVVDEQTRTDQPVETEGEPEA